MRKLALNENNSLFFSFFSDSSLASSISVMHTGSPRWMTSLTGRTYRLVVSRNNMENSLFIRSAKKQAAGVTA